MLEGPPKFFSAFYHFRLPIKSYIFIRAECCYFSITLILLASVSLMQQPIQTIKFVNGQCFRMSLCPRLPLISEKTLKIPNITLSNYYR